MKLTNRTLMIIAIVIIIIVIALGLWWADSSNFFTKNNANNPNETNESYPIENNNANYSPETNYNRNENLTYSGWMPNWATDAGIATLQKSGDRLHSISPVWYELGEEGELVSKKPARFQEVLDIAAAKNITVIPTISMFDHELFTRSFENPAAINSHAQAIAAEVDKYNYDGFDFNYESTKLSDKDKFFELLSQTDKLLEERNKTFVVTVLSQWSSASDYRSFRETRQVQDWNQIAAYADEIRLMTYDYTFSTSLNPGPIAPTSWVEEVITTALTKTTAEKLVLGVNLYSYEWWEETAEYEEKLAEGVDPLQFVADGEINLPLRKKAARSYTYETNMRIIEEEKGEQSEFESEKVFKFERENPQTGKLETRVLVYPDEDTLAAKFELAKKYGLKGVVFWRLGGEGELLNTTISPKQ